MNDLKSRVAGLAHALLAGNLSTAHVMTELKQLSHCSGSEGRLVHVLCHYIADEDLFEGDQAYREHQRRRLQKLIQETEAAAGNCDSAP